MVERLTLVQKMRVHLSLGALLFKKNLGFGSFKSSPKLVAWKRGGALTSNKVVPGSIRSYPEVSV